MTEGKYVDFAKRLRMAMSANGMTSPHELAEVTGLKRITIGNYMRGERRASIEACITIGDALGVNPGWLHSNAASDKYDIVRGQKISRKHPDYFKVEPANDAEACLNLACVFIQEAMRRMAS